jgi:hypothetical protein
VGIAALDCSVERGSARQIAAIHLLPEEYGSGVVWLLILGVILSARKPNFTTTGKRRPYAIFPKSLATLSSTPLTNCTDSKLENLRAISSASLITTARGVSG